MSAYITGSSALYYWRRSVTAHKQLQRLVYDPLCDCPMTPDQLHELDLDNGRFGPAPIRLMVPSHDLRIAKRSFRYSVHGDALPETAFCEAERNVCLASPEYCLLQSARVYSFFGLLELCMELCGKYAMTRESMRGFVSRDFALASVESIGRFLHFMQGEPGAAVVQKALAYVLDGSRSPMETRAYLLMCLPKRMGGYALPKPVLNERIALMSEEHVVARRRYLECDLCWSDQKIVVEYDGQADHASRADRDKDSIKRNILLSKGYAVYTITSGQICNVRSFDKVVREIAERLRHRFHRFPENWEQRRDELRGEIFKSMAQRE